MRYTLNSQSLPDTFQPLRPNEQILINTGNLYLTYTYGRGQTFGEGIQIFGIIDENRNFHKIDDAPIHEQIRHLKGQDKVTMKKAVKSAFEYDIVTGLANLLEGGKIIRAQIPGKDPQFAPLVPA